MHPLSNCFLGSAVYWPDRNKSGLNAFGIISGIIWSTESYGSLWCIPNNGVVIEFEQDERLVRFFVTFNQLEGYWNGCTFEIESATFLELTDKTKKTIFNRIGSFAYCVSNRRCVPVWTCYVWEEQEKMNEDGTS